jgi:hypothetical protein
MVLGALWYFFPAWVPRRLPRLRRPHWRWPRWTVSWRWPGWIVSWRWARLRELLLAWLRSLRWSRRRRRVTEPVVAPELAPVPGDELPDLSSAAFASLADQLAAQGRYAEAVRERLRAMVRCLVERGVIEDRPGWTVTELAAAAGAALPAVAPPLTEAAGVFSDIWYGGRPAHAAADARMRALERDLRESLTPKPMRAATANGGRL